MSERASSIFRRYYEEVPFADRYESDAERAVDVIVPVVHTNELWRANLLSFYREVPIHKLWIADGGCIDDSIEIAEGFPRVEVLDHHEYKSLGYSIRKMIEAVEMDWFIYVHSDAYLPPGWFDVMEAHQSEYEWFGCPMQHTVMVEYDNDYGVRPWAGSQMGLKRAFDTGLDHIDDDYVYRQEDFVFADIVKKAGFREGKVAETFHYHQTIHKPSPWMRKVKSVNFELEISPEEEIRTWTMQLKGTIKYLSPSNPWALKEVYQGIAYLLDAGLFDWREMKKWTAEINPVWLPYISKIWFLLMQLRSVLGRIYRVISK